MEYKDVISRIKSVRNYKEDTVSPEILEKLKADFEKGKRLIDDIQLEVMLKNKDEVYGNLKNIAGYNDLMIEAPHYLIFLSEDKGHYIENTGYAVQNIMLKAFESGVGSCWITIKDGEAIKEKLNINSDKKLSALIALGYDDNKNKVLYENVSEYNPSRAEVEIVEDNVSERMRVRDLVYLNKWGEDADPDELTRVGLLDAFFYARLAPSTKNRQPWRFIYDNGTVVLALRKDENVNEYEQKVDTGIVMLYFKLIVDSTLFNLEWKFGNPDKDYEIPSDYEIVAYCIS
ncbi:MAG TPA: nitroreductase [Clostridiales bacterium]|nr:nitroreductase [Clostridiales bacterium]